MIAAMALAAVLLAEPTPTPGFVTGRTWPTTIRVDVAPSAPPAGTLLRTIARGRAVLARSRDRDERWRTISELEEALWFAHRYGELRALLAQPAADAPYPPSKPAADGPFFAGDRLAAFRVYVPYEFIPGLGRHPYLARAQDVAVAGRWRDAIALLSRVHDSDNGYASDKTGQEQTARLLAGDAFAACGWFRAARRSWLTALENDIPISPDMFGIPPMRTSALLRLLRYRTAPDRPLRTPGCAGLP